MGRKGPNHTRGNRGKRTTKPKERESARPAEEQAHRLQQAITKRLVRNPLLSRSPVEETPFDAGASSSGAPPADSQEHRTTGVVHVSLDSESDISLPPSDEGSDTGTTAGITAEASTETTTTTTPTPYHTVTTTRVSDGRLVFTTCIHLTEHPFAG